MTIIRIGLDTSKHVFSDFMELTRTRKPVLRRAAAAQREGRGNSFCPDCRRREIGTEACGALASLGRGYCAALGPRGCLSDLPPQYIKGYGQMRGKRTDAIDAEGDLRKR